MIVSLCVIAYNEEQNIGSLFDNIVEQDYPHENVEIVLVDGNSTDNTKKLMEDFKSSAHKFLSVKVLDNPKRIQSAGWNVAIRAAAGDLIIRIDAHALIPPEFITENVNCILEGESVCGGRRENIIKGDGFSKKVLLMAENSMFGSGIAKYRNTGKKQYVKTVAHACYRKEVFGKVGLFNEKLLRSEDNELHYRIRENGYKICMSDKINSQYLTRNTLKGMLKQKFGNGKWIGITAKLSPKIFSLYHFIPFVFVMVALAFAALFGITFTGLIPRWLGLPFICGVGLYLLIDLILTVKSCQDYKEWRAVFVLPFLFPLLHFAYGFGTLCGLLICPFKNLKFNAQIEITDE